MNIEPLESRIAPASIALTYTDIDGDHVKITASKAGTVPPPLTTSDFTLSGGQLQELDVSDPGFNGASIVFTVTRSEGGDGLAAVGRILGGTNNFDTITVAGDLGRISCGGSTAGTPALAALNARSMGDYGLVTQSDSKDFTSTINGALGKFNVTGDIIDAYIHVNGETPAVSGIGSIQVGGSLLGLDPNPAVGDHPGSIESNGDIGSVSIGHDLRGVAAGSGFIQSDRGNIGGVGIGGSLIGGRGQFSGEIRSGGNLGPVKIAGDVRGGDGAESGFIASDTGFGVDRGNIASISIGGAMVGGAGIFSGSIRSSLNLGPIRVGGDVRGGSGDESAKIDAGGAGATALAAAHATGAITSITIGGSLVSELAQYGLFVDGSGLNHEGQIFSIGSIGVVTIGGDVKAGEGAGSGDIISGGNLKSLTIGGSLIGGSTNFTGWINSTGTMGLVKIGSDIVGGPHISCGYITGGSLADVHLGGSLIGGAIISFGPVGMITIAGDMRGDAGGGIIQSNGKMAGITIGGSLVGGAQEASGMILSQGDLGTVKIGRDFIGGSNSSASNSLPFTGVIRSLGRIASVTIGGSVLAGVSAGGQLVADAAIYAAHDIGSIVIKGDVVGALNADGTFSRVVFSARGQAIPSRIGDLAIGQLTIGGRAEYLNVLAGYLLNGDTPNPADGNAQIGTVNIGGDLIASNIIAGVQDGGAAGFGDAGDTIIGGSAKLSKIAHIVVGGTVAGTGDSGDQFGIESHTIGSVKINGFLMPIPTAPASAGLSPITGYDVTVRTV